MASPSKDVCLLGASKSSKAGPWYGLTGLTDKVPGAFTLTPSTPLSLSAEMSGLERKSAKKIYKLLIAKSLFFGFFSKKRNDVSGSASVEDECINFK